MVSVLREEQVHLVEKFRQMKLEVVMHPPKNIQNIQHMKTSYRIGANEVLP